MARAERAFPEMRSMPAHRRRAILQGVHGRLAEDREKFARLITSENQKPIRDSRDEMNLAADTIEYYGGAANKYFGNTIPVAGKGLA